jgi:hypothetical protein
MRRCGKNHLGPKGLTSGVRNCRGWLARGSWFDGARRYDRPVCRRPLSARPLHQTFGGVLTLPLPGLSAESRVGGDVERGVARATHTALDLPTAYDICISVQYSCAHDAPLRTARSDRFTRVLRLRLKDRHASWLRDLAFHVNQVWNYANELGYKVWQRERRFISAVEIDRYTAGATKEGLPLHSQTVQAITRELVIRRRQFRKVKLRWRVSNGSRRSLGWIPFKASAIRYRNGQVHFMGQALNLWDSFGLAQFDLGPAISAKMPGGAGISM